MQSDGIAAASLAPTNTANKPAVAGSNPVTAGYALQDRRRGLAECIAPGHGNAAQATAYCLALAARSDEAREHLAAIRRRLPGYRVDDFLAAMQFEPSGAELFRNAAKKLG